MKRILLASVASVFVIGSAQSIPEGGWNFHAIRVMPGH